MQQLVVVSHRERVQNQSHDSHLVIFDWNSKKWLDGGTARSLVISCCVKASEQTPHTKPDLLPNISRNEAALRSGGVEGFDEGERGWVTIFNRQHSREVTKVKVQENEWLICFKNAETQPPLNDIVPPPWLILHESNSSECLYRH